MSTFVCFGPYFSFSTLTLPQTKSVIVTDKVRVVVTLLRNQQTKIKVKWYCFSATQTQERDICHQLQLTVKILCMFLISWNIDSVIVQTVKTAHFTALQNSTDGVNT